MKNLIFASLVLAASATASFAQTTKPTPAQTAPANPTMSTKTKAEKTRNVAFLVYDGVESLDLGGPLDVFNKANSITGGYNAYTVGLTHDTVQAEAQSFGLTPKFSIDDAPRPDIIIVPGASSQRVNEMGKNPRVQNWLRANVQPGQTMMSICTGAFIVGEAGLFDGKDVTTHWMTLPQFATQFPLARTYDGVRYIGDGNIYSSGGITSGIDGALHLVEQFSGKAAADSVAKVLQYRRDTPVFPDANKARVQGAPANAKPLALDNTDPVCHMKVAANTPNTYAYKGETYGFCSADCRDEFAADPAKYLAKKSR